MGPSFVRLILGIPEGRLSRRINSAMRTHRSACEIAGVVMLLLGGCGGGPKVGQDPLSDMQDSSKDPRDRAAAVDASWKQASGDSVRVAGVQRALKTMAWNASEPPALRVKALETLMTDSDAKVVEDAREMGRLMLAREVSRQVVVYLCKTAGERGWTDYVPSIVRSYSRPSPVLIKEAERAENIALRELNPGKTVQEVAFEMFVNPPEMPAAYGVDWPQRLRADAWDVLARIDREGELRRQLMDRITSVPQSDPLLANMSACARDLHAMPIAGMELAWLTSLRDPAKKSNAAWWSEASRAIARQMQEHSATMGDSRYLSLRHVEAIRWASVHRASWLAMEREDLVGELQSRMKSRRTTIRKWGATQAPYSELLKDTVGRLRWADLLTMLVIDDAMRSGGVATALGRQAELDKKDTTTEYGGMVIARGEGGEARFEAVLFPPRPGQRRGDQHFVASDDMISASDLALVHYHFHTQTWANSDYAGPSPEDLEYAAKSGRSCVVLTGVSDGVVNVDYYQPDGVVVDLGELRVK